MLPLPKNQAFCNIFQPPGDDVDGNFGASSSDQDHSPLTRQCLELLTGISAAVDRNTKMIDLLANHIVMNGRPGASRATGGTTSSSAAQESEDESDENVSEAKTRRFRARAKRPKHKDANELRLRVSRFQQIDLVS